MKQKQTPTAPANAQASRTFTVKRLSGCLMVGNVEFSGDGLDSDSQRANEYCAFLNLQPRNQTQKAFFALADVRNQQEAQKKSRYGAPVHRLAYLRICELAKQSPTASKHLNPKDY